MGEINCREKQTFSDQNQPQCSYNISPEVRGLEGTQMVNEAK
jgi:hypothetical protein